MLGLIFAFSMGGIFLPSLMAFVDVYLNICASSVSDMSVGNNSAVGVGGTLRPSPPCLVHDYLRC